MGHDKYFLPKTVTRQWNQHATKQGRATEHEITVTTEDGILSQRKANKCVPVKVYFLKCSWYSHKILKLIRKLLSEFLSNMERI